jgi:hypothetical protein
MSHAPLHPDTRSLLSREILKARDAAEEGARASLAALRVGESTPAEGMSVEERSLRNRLRANGRQLGDRLLADGTQELGSLVEEIAYQHWHRMLFARFLAENGLLREDQGDQPIDLAECEALANAEGLDIWAYAARCAQKMLPGVFRLDDPKLELRLDTPRQLELNAILKALPSQVFTATDALGWVYQYWQAKRKDEVNASGVKIGAKELSPVTQLFTEDYMVDFLLHNTLGAWWAGKMGPIEAADESGARAKATLPAKDGLPAVEWIYLRFVQDSETKKWMPAAGTFEGWPKKAKDITFLDPCMGSGHFPAFALPILARMRMEEEGGNAAANLRAVLKDQIHGLELDQRCCQIGAFNLALTAWKLGGFQQLPPLNVACCGIAPAALRKDWVALAKDDLRLQHGMARLYTLFENAPVLGSLINPCAGEGDLLMAAFHELQPLLDKALARETKDDTSHEMAVAARGQAKAAEILASQFTLVATNVPYLGRGKQDEVLMDYCERVHPEAKADLATCFVERCIDFNTRGGSVALVTPQNWLFQSGFQKLRVRLLSESEWSGIAKLGTKAFQGIAGEVVTVALTVLCREQPRDDHCLFGLDVGSSSTPDTKAEALASNLPRMVGQKDQHNNPEARIGFDVREAGASQLGDYCECYQGVVTGDISRWVIRFWEVDELDSRLWSPCRAPSDGNSPFDGQHDIVRWEQGKGQLHDYAALTRDQLHDMHESGNLAWGRPGVVINRVKTLRAGLYYGEIYHNSVAAIVPKDQALIRKVWAFCNSPSFEEEVRRLSPALGVTNRVLIQIPFNPDDWEGELTKPFSSDPTQWLFNGHPNKSGDALQVAVARMLGYQWPRKTGSEFPDCSALGPDGLEKHHDDDGVVPLASINREEAAATRLRALLKDAYGSEWNPAATEKELLASLGHADLTLEEWLQDEFFEEHCKLFHHRPFVWHIWDGAKDGFHVLVNYHRLAAGNGDGTRLLQKIATTYLGDWIARCNQEVAADKPGAAARLKAAQDLQADLRKILEGEAPHDIFVRWKPLREQSIGWEPDINDGVRLNIRPFLTARNVGKKGAGMLRFKPNIKWDKDRGSEPQRPKADFPWFWSCDPESNTQHQTDFAGGSAFTGERWNDLHYTLAAKKAARAKKA